MNEKMFLPSGFLNWKWLKSLPGNFIFVWGGRGTGKTYGGLLEFLSTDEPIIYTRRTERQAQFIASPKMQPYKSINADTGDNVQPFSIDGLTEFYHATENDKGKLIPDPDRPLVAILTALSTMANLRGFDGSDFKSWIYDEFIPQRDERPIKFECDALLNAYETINRNRELKGEKPLKLYALSNSNRLDNAIFIGLNLVSPALDMMRKGQEVRYLPKRGITLVNIAASPVSAQKKDTALYRAAGNDSEFGRMALFNEFVGEEEHAEVSRNLKEYKPIVFVGEISIYQHKSKQTYYISEHRTGTADNYGSGEIELKRFQNRYFSLWRSYLNNSVEFETRTCEILFCRYMGEKG